MGKVSVYVSTKLSGLGKLYFLLLLLGRALCVVHAEQETLELTGLVGFLHLDHKESNFFIIFNTSAFPMVAIGLTAAFAVMGLVISVNFFSVLKI